MCLMSNMVFSDFFVSFYIFILVCIRLKFYIEFMLFMKNFCNVFGFIWFFSVIVSIKMLFIFIVEWYLVVVYCM